MGLFTDRHRFKIRGDLSCFECVVTAGTIPGICCAGMMTKFLYASAIRIFDYPKWTEPLREEIRDNLNKILHAF